MTERTAVYRLFDASDVLLYIGIAKNFGRRWQQHARQQEWWPSVVSQTVRWYPTRPEAKAVETEAIHAEAPIHNVQESPWEKRVKDDGTGFYVVPKPSKELHGPFEHDSTHIVGMHEIAEMLGVTRSRAGQLARERNGLPEPLGVLRAGSVWERSVIEAWARKTGRTLTA